MGRRRVRRLAVVATAGVLGTGSLLVAMEASAAEGNQLQVRAAAGTNSIFIVTATQETGPQDGCFQIGQSAVLQPFGNNVVEVGTPVRVLSFTSTDCTFGRIGDCRTEMPAASGATLFPELDATRCTWTGA